MKLTNIKNKFKKETNADVYNGGNGLCKWEYSVEYVEWLEKQLLLYGVSQQRELLLDFAYSRFGQATKMLPKDKVDGYIKYKSNNCG